MQQTFELLSVSLSLKCWIIHPSKSWDNSKSELFQVFRKWILLNCELRNGFCCLLRLYFSYFDWRFVNKFSLVSTNSCYRPNFWWKDTRVGRASLVFEYVYFMLEIEAIRVWTHSVPKTGVWVISQVFLHPGFANSSQTLINLELIGTLHEYLLLISTQFRICPCKDNALSCKVLWKKNGITCKKGAVFNEIGVWDGSKVGSNWSILRPPERLKLNLNWFYACFENTIA